jgi:hypothetical protein
MKQVESITLLLVLDLLVFDSFTGFIDDAKFVRLGLTEWSHQEL